MGLSRGALFATSWQLFSGPFLDPFFYSFLLNSGGNFRDFFWRFFALGRELAEAAFLKDLPSKIVVFGGPGVQESLLKAAPKGIQKRTPKKTRKSHFWGVGFGVFLGLLGASWA